MPRLGMASYFMIITRNGRDGKKWSLVVVVVVWWWWCGGGVVVVWWWCVDVLIRGIVGGT